MRRVYLGPSPMPSTPELKFIITSLREIERATFENDPGEIADSFTVTNCTETRTLDCNTATAADIADVLGTFLLDLKRRGVRKG